MSLVCPCLLGQGPTSGHSVAVSTFLIGLLLCFSLELRRREGRQFVSLTSPISLAQVTGLSPLSLS